jgi:prepilin-type N-terminal cleavage/methylation domain-containing protein
VDDPVTWVRRRLSSGAGSRDAGMSLIEVLVGMSIMAAFMAIFTSGMVGMFDSANKSESVNNAQTQLNLAFIRLDKEVRYAAAISTPGQKGTDWYVEFLTTNQGSDKATCTQLRLNAALRKLERRTWLQKAGPDTATTWAPLASEVASTEPFTSTPADGTFNFQRLRLRLAAAAGAGKSATATETDVTFTALNTSRKASAAETEADAIVCTEGRPS